MRILRMPELPEVETTRATLAQRVAGARIVEARLGKPLRWPFNIDASSLRGQRIGAVRRRGKYLWFELHDERDTTQSSRERGSGDDLRRGGLLVHLGMSGSLAWVDAAAQPDRHDHFDLVTERGTLRLTDPRRFGAVLWSRSLDDEPAAALLASLGPEPFDEALDAASFHAALHRHRSAVKAVLLSGKAVVGAGNIYACEALFAAGIDPRTRADRISRPRAAKLLDAVRSVLARAIDAGGTTLRDYRNADGDAGRFQNEAKVYGREGLPCTVCTAPVRRVLTGQRASYFCARCQRRS
jgi:formamidopyrimidine-DNA glycosylase